MGKLRDRLGSLFIRLYLSYVVIVLLIVSMLCLFSMYAFTESFTEELVSKNMGIMKQLRDNVDHYILKAADDLIVYTLSGDEDITQLFRAPVDMNYVTLSRAYEKLKRLVYTGSSADSIYLYYKNNGIVLSSGGMAFLNGKVPPSMDVQWLLDQDPEKSRQYRILELPAESGGKVISYTRKYPFGVRENRMLGSLTVNISLSRLQDQVTNLADPIFGDIYILDEFGGIIMDNGNSDVSQGPDLREWSDVIFNLEGNGMPQLLRTKEYYVFYDRSPESGWYFVNAVPLRYYHDKLAHVRNAAAFIGILAVVIPLLLAYPWAKKLYHPIRMLADKSKGIKSTLPGEMPEQSPDVEIISDTLGALVTRMDILQARLTKDRPKLVKSLLLRLLQKDGIMQEELEGELDRLGLKFPHSQYCALYIQMERSIGGKDPVAPDPLVGTLEKSVDAICRNGCTKCAAQISDGELAVLVNADDAEIGMQLAQEICAQAKADIGIGCVVGVGDMYSTTEKVYLSYSQAKEAVLYEYVYPGRGVWTAAEARVLNEGGLKWEKGWDEEFTRHLNEGKLSQLYLDVETIFQRFSGRNNSYSCVKARIYEMIQIVEKKAESIGMSPREVFGEELVPLFQSAENILHTRQILLTVCERVLRYEGDLAARRPTSEILRVKDYIINKVLEKRAEELTLGEVAEHFGKSPNYFSTLFSESAGVSFKDFIVEAKLERAEKELHRQGVRIVDLARDLGYYNTSYFIKIFKRKYGCTPKQYYDRLHHAAIQGKESGTMEDIERFLHPEIYQEEAYAHPDFSQLLRVLERKKPDRPVLFEFFLNNTLFDAINEDRVYDSADPYGRTRKIVDTFCRLGYDYATLYAADYTFLPRRKKDKASVSQDQNAVIRDRETYEAYKWPEPENYDFSRLDFLADYLPHGMKAIPYCSAGGILEGVVELAGYTGLCYMMADDPELVSELFNQVGRRIYDYYRICAGHPAVGAVMVSDDWGFRTQTLLSTGDLRRYVFPWHKKIVDLVHSVGKPALLHSCGNLSTVMDDVIGLGFQGKHSYEDAILPVEDFYDRFGSRIAVLGGLDVDFICRSTPQDIYTRAVEMLRHTQDGGYALGSGNSIPDYVPMKNYFAMIAAALEQRNE